MLLEPLKEIPPYKAKNSDYVIMFVGDSNKLYVVREKDISHDIVSTMTNAITIVMGMKSLEADANWAGVSELYRENEKWIKTLT